jgi:hypothetical protein
VSATRGSADSVTMAQFPPMDARSWCGEWGAADDTVLPLALEQADVGDFAPPFAAAADEFLSGTESIIFAEAASGAETETNPEPAAEAAEEESDPFDAILQIDDTELWEDAARFDDTTVASDTQTDDDAPAGNPWEAGEGPSDELFLDDTADGAEGDQTDLGAEHDEGQNGSDFVMSVISRRAEADPLGRAELPDPSEWMKNYPDQSADGSDPVTPRTPAHVDPAADGTDEWPDWSQWLESQAGGELRLDRTADRTIADDPPAADEDAGPGPVPEPPPWLNEPQKPKLMGWARRVWR